MSTNRDQELETLVAVIAEGWSRLQLAGHAWGVTRTTHAAGKVISLSAQRLSDTEQLGANIWLTAEGPILRPCEVPAEKVLQFLRDAATANAPAEDGAPAGLDIPVPARTGSAPEGCE